MAWQVLRHTLLLVVVFQMRLAAQPVPEPQVAQGVSAAALLRQGKATQDWFSKIKSVYIRFDDGSILAFDESRLYEARAFGAKTFVSWDGALGVRFTSTGTLELLDKLESISQTFMTSSVWGRSGQVYWWTRDQARPSDLLREAVADQPVRIASRNGIDCYLVRVQFEADVWIGVKDHLIYQTGRPEFVFEDYKEVAPGCWYPMTQKQGSRTLKVAEIVIDKPLPAELFASPFVEGMNVHDTRGGVSTDYVYRAEQDSGEAAEILADAARRKRFAEPPLVPGQGVRLNPPATPLPLNPLAINPAPQFPAEAKWVGGEPKKLADLRGKVVMLVFWASWSKFIESPWGRDEKPAELKIPEALKDDVMILGIHVPTKNPDRVEKAMKTLGISFPVCIDVSSGKPDEAWGIMSEAYRIEDMPITHVINSEGRVAYRGSFGPSLLRAGELVGKPVTQQEP